jgi:hypothetical protein
VESEERRTASATAALLSSLEVVKAKAIPADALAIYEWGITGKPSGKAAPPSSIDHAFADLQRRIVDEAGSMSTNDLEALRAYASELASTVDIAFNRAYREELARNS